MIIKKITREKLYKREYDKEYTDKTVNFNNDYLINILTPIIALAIKDSDDYDI